VRRVGCGSANAFKSCVKDSSICAIVQLYLKLNKLLFMLCLSCFMLPRSVYIPLHVIVYFAFISLNIFCHTYTLCRHIKDGAQSNDEIMPEGAHGLCEYNNMNYFAAFMVLLQFVVC